MLRGVLKSRLSSTVAKWRPVYSKQAFSVHTKPKNASEAAIKSDSSRDKPFDKILIANRGEIACRVIRTAKKLGVKTVAIYSEHDYSGLHVRMADEAYLIDSYLNMNSVLKVAQDTGAQAIHPGYGFLSENSKFVNMVEKAGIAFIGPGTDAIHAMGDKINSKIIAKNAGCFIIPGYDGEITSGDHAVEIAHQIGKRLDIDTTRTT